MRHGNDPWAALAELIERLDAQRRELLLAEFAKVHAEHRDLAERVEQLEKRNTFPEALATHLGRNAIKAHAASSGLSPQEQRAVERACAADPTEGAQRVDLPDLGWVAYTKPGAEPKVTSSSLETLQGEEAVNVDVQRTPHSHRARRH